MSRLAKAGYIAATVAVVAVVLASLGAYAVSPRGEPGSRRSLTPLLSARAGPP